MKTAIVAGKYLYSIPNKEVKPVTSECCSLRQEAKHGCCLRFFIFSEI